MDSGGSCGGGAPGQDMKPGDWLCPGCRDHQFARNLQCRKCGTPNPNLNATGQPNLAADNTGGHHMAAAATMAGGATSAGEMGAAAAAAATAASMSGGAAMVDTAMAGGLNAEQMASPGPWQSEEAKPASAMQAENEALKMRNGFLETVANEQAQKIFILEEQLRHAAIEMSAAAERIRVAESEATRTRAGVGQSGLVSLAASIVPGGPSSARQLGTHLLAFSGQGKANVAQAVPVGSNPPSWAKWPGDAVAAKYPVKSSSSDADQFKTDCWHFVNLGKCEYGNKCRFRHPAPHNVRGSETAASMYSSQQGKADSEQSKADCWDFVNLGKCTYGDKCYFRHPAGNHLQSSEDGSHRLLAWCRKEGP